MVRSRVTVPRVMCAAAKLEDASFDHIPSASRPSSPDTQLAATSPGQGAELSREEAATYTGWGRGVMVSVSLPLSPLHQVHHGGAEG